MINNRFATSIAESAAFFTSTLLLNKASPYWIDGPISLSRSALFSSVNAISLSVPDFILDQESSSIYKGACKVASLALGIAFLYIFAKPLAKHTHIVINPYSAAKLAVLHGIIKVAIDQISLLFNPSLPQKTPNLTIIPKPPKANPEPPPKPAIIPATSIEPPAPPKEPEPQKDPWATAKNVAFYTAVAFTIIGLTVVPTALFIRNHQALRSPKQKDDSKIIPIETSESSQPPSFETALSLRYPSIEDRYGRGSLDDKPQPPSSKR